MYNQIARYYDLVHADLTADIGYLLTLAAGVDGAILELGCGTGRLLIPLARAGHAIIGVDNAAAMLDRARQKIAVEPPEVRQRITLLASDIVSFSLPAQAERFALAFIGYNTLMHLSPEQVVAVFNRIGRCLQPGGTLFLDLANPATIAQTADDHTLSLENTLVDPETGELILQMAANRLEEGSQLLHITWIYDATPAGGGPVSRTVVETDYHYFYAHQLEIFLDQAGFRIDALMGDYDQSPFGEESARLLIVAGLENNRPQV